MGRVVWVAIRTRIRVGVLEIKELGLSPSYYVVDWLVVCDDTEKLLITTYAGKVLVPQQAP